MTLSPKKFPFSLLCLPLVMVAILWLPKASRTDVANHAQSAARASAKPRVVESFGRLPLSFEPNMGQTNSRVEFLSRGHGYTLFLKPTEAVLSLKRRGAGQPLRMKLAGANHAPAVAGVDELPGKSNYLIGNDPSRWRTNIPTYRKVKYKDVYPGIDLIYYGKQRQLEYDFVVAPGADPKTIRLDFQGAENTRIDAKGDLVLETGAEQIRVHKPLIYQQANGQETKGVRHEISGGFLLAGNGQVSFSLGAYDASEPIVIDPVLVYSTYVGGSADNECDAITIDSSGNAYVSGSTSSTDFPVTDGVLQSGKKDKSDDGRDAFIAKISPDGTELVWATYIGGTDGDDTSGIFVSSAGNVYVAGNTTSTDFPTTDGAFQKTTQLRGCGPGADQTPCSGMYVLQLNPAGSALVYSTYIGGSGDAMSSLDVDSAGNAYVAGAAASAAFPTTPGAFQTSFKAANGGMAFISKLNATGTGLVYSSFLGGADDQSAYDIHVDAAGNAFMTGQTTSADFPTTAGAFQKTLTAGNCGTVAKPAPCSDAFVTKLNPAGSSLVFSTYLGGSRADQALSLSIDSSGAVYVTGNTNSANFPVANALQRTFAGVTCGSGATAVPCSNAFITKLDPTGASLVYSTYLGGDGVSLPGGGDGGSDIATDSLGNAYVVGASSSKNFPTMSALDGITGCPCPNFIAKLSPAGVLLYSTPLGPDTDIRSVVVDNKGNAYITGEADSEDFPTTDGAFQTKLTGSSAGYFTKLADQTAP